MSLSDAIGGLGVLLLIYWFWAINRPAIDRPHAVRGLGAFALPGIGAVLMFLGWG